MAGLSQPADNPPIDIWRTREGQSTAGSVNKQLSRIYTSVNVHEIEDLTQPGSYEPMHGTIIVIITSDILNMLNLKPPLNFAKLRSNKPHRYYVDRSNLLADYNTRASLFGGEIWIRVDLDGDKKSLMSVFRQIVHNTCTMNDADNVGPIKRQKQTSKTKRGAFQIVPNEFQYGKMKKVKGVAPLPDGTVLIDPSKLQWAYIGDPVIAYLVNQEDKTSPRINVNLLPIIPNTVFSFSLPDGLKPSTYMMHIRDGNTANSYLLGNRSITVYSPMTYISANLFSEEYLAALCKVGDMSMKENCGIVDTALSECFTRSQLPLMLPQYLGREFPTLLHVACYYGLKELLFNIMDSFCSLNTLNIANVNLKTPGELAKERGHDQLAQLLANQLVIEDMYVAHAPLEIRETLDIYDTVSFPSCDKYEHENGYVSGVVIDSGTIDEDNDDCIYMDANDRLQDYRPGLHPRTLSLNEPPHPTTQNDFRGAGDCHTLPSRFRSHMLFEDDIPEDALVSPDPDINNVNEMKRTFHMVADGEINENLAEEHIRDWSKRMKSLKRLGLEQRLKVQKEIKTEMEQKYIGSPSEAVTKKTPTPPPLKPRKPTSTLPTTQPAQPTKSKKLPALPPTAPPAPVVAPRRRLPRSVDEDDDDDDGDYLVATSTKPGLGSPVGPY